MGTPHGKAQPLAVRTEQIKKLAAEGRRAKDIAAQLGIGVQQIKNIAKGACIKLPKPQRLLSIPPETVVENTVRTLTAMLPGLEDLHSSPLAGFTRDDAIRLHAEVQYARGQLYQLQAKLNRQIKHET